MTARRRLLGVAAAMALTILVPRTAAAVPVSLELLLLVDVSGSVNATEYNLQKQGYIDAFNDAGIQAAITAASGGIAVAYAEWSGAGEQSLLVNFAHLTDAASASNFATAIAGTSRAFNGNTAPGSAIGFGAPLFVGNGFEGSRLVMDVSGDGAANEGANTFAAAAAAHAAGITINGLAILGEAGLQTFYQDNIVTPGGGFLVAAASFADFSRAVQTKIGREITDVPEPGTLALLGIGLAVAGRRLRKPAA